MTVRTKALFVHLLTATGAVWAMLAMLAAVEGKWDVMFLWLVVALFVDGIDGPLARRYDVRRNAAEFDGVLLDLIIDYLTYVFVPAYALFKSGLLPGWPGWTAIIVINFASAMYFADTRMKTRDYSFSGFPSCWNMVVLVLFALHPDRLVSLIIVTVLALTMFVPIKFVHPMRTQRWRQVTLPMTVGWLFFAGWAAFVNFHPESWSFWGLAITSLWLLLAGAAQQVIYGKEG
ncbi:MAG: CDP-alcohol phosphatidyltransferase family protein [Rubellimicrobium sp.]|nr:CDP-alcohol phosphatidyltransferase family protein [Rubellimicrobium sp.]